jgi:hypothetical protein
MLWTTSSWAKSHPGKLKNAILARSDFPEVFVEASIEGAAWTAVEFAVAKSHTRLAMGMESFIKRMNPTPELKSDVKQPPQAQVILFLRFCRYVDCWRCAGPKHSASQHHC